MAPGPVVPGPGLTEHKVVRPEDLTERARPQSLQRPGLQVHQDSPGHELLVTALRVEDVDLVPLAVRVPTEPACQVETVLRVESLPEGGAHLVTALTDLGNVISRKLSPPVTATVTATVNLPACG